MEKNDVTGGAGPLERAEREDRYARLELKRIAEKTDPSISSLTLLKWEARVARQAIIDKLKKDANRFARRQRTIERLWRNAHRPQAPA